MKTFSPSWSGNLTRISLPIGFTNSATCQSTLYSAWLTITGKHNGITTITHTQPTAITCNGCQSVGLYCTQWQNMVLGTMLNPCTSCPNGHGANSTFIAIPQPVVLGDLYTVTLNLTAAVTGLVYAMSLSSTSGYEEMGLVPPQGSKVVTFQTYMTMGPGGGSATTTPNTWPTSSHCSCPSADPSCNCSPGSSDASAIYGPAIGGLIAAAVLVYVIYRVILWRKRANRYNFITPTGYAPDDDDKLAEVAPTKLRETCKIHGLDRISP